MGFSISKGLVIVAVSEASSYLIYDCFSMMTCTEIAGSPLSLGSGYYADGPVSISSEGLVAAIFTSSSNDYYIAFFKCNFTTCTPFGDYFPVSDSVDSVAISGNLVAVGAYAGSDSQGQVTVFTCNSTSCTPSTPFSTTDSEQMDYFGSAVTWFGTVLIVGAPFGNGGAGAVPL